MLLSYTEVAEQLGVKRSLVVKWVERDQIPHLRLGPRTVRFDSEKIAAWLAARSVSASEPPTSSE
jgi:excisionase family DNA binding protein